MALTIVRILSRVHYTLASSPRVTSDRAPNVPSKTMTMHVVNPKALANQIICDLNKFPVGHDADFPY
jgi:hypothetical protein